MATTMNMAKHDKSHVLNTTNVDRLVALAKEKSHRMPSGLTREQRREWAKNVKQRVS